LGLWDVLRGQRRAKAPNLDNLFAVPGAAVTLQTALGLAPTGVGSVCFRAAEGAASQSAEDVATTLVEQDGPVVERQVDTFGFTWLVVRRAPDDVSGLVTDLHAVNTELELQGSSVLPRISMFGFADPGGRRLGLVYLYKQGTFYPFAPSGPQQRDNLLEIQLRDTLAPELPMEQDLQRWLALWGAPGF